MRSYRNMILAISVAIAERAKELGDDSLAAHARTLASHAIQVGHIEECLDEQVEDARHSEIAHWDMACEPSARFVQ